MCCENEFGLKYMNDRNKCMDKCEDGTGNKKGNWVWVPNRQKIN